MHNLLSGWLEKEGSWDDEEKMCVRQFVKQVVGRMQLLYNVKLNPTPANITD